MAPHPDIPNNRVRIPMSPSRPTTMTLPRVPVLTPGANSPWSHGSEQGVGQSSKSKCPSREGPWQALHACSLLGADRGRERDGRRWRACCCSASRSPRPAPGYLSEFLGGKEIIPIDPLLDRGRLQRRRRRWHVARFPGLDRITRWLDAHDQQALSCGRSYVSGGGPRTGERFLYSHMSPVVVERRCTCPAQAALDGREVDTIDGPLEVSADLVLPIEEEGAVRHRRHGHRMVRQRDGEGPVALLHSGSLIVQARALSVALRPLAALVHLPQQSLPMPTRHLRTLLPSL